MISGRISVVAPCLNEEDNVEVLYVRLSRECYSRGIDFELVLVDDGSTDDTWKKCVELRDQFPLRVVIAQHEMNLGIPKAWQTGLEKAQGDLVCLIDSDLQNPPECVAKLHDTYVANDYDFVRGVRIPNKENYPLRRVASKVLNSILNRSFGMDSLDNKSGFLLGSREKMSRIIQHSGKYRHFQTFIGVSARCRGYSVMEVPTPFELRQSGVSFLDGNVFRTVLNVLADLREARKEFRFERHISNE